MIAINDDISIDDKDLSYDFIRASGPGGQNVNKVATAVQLRFDVKGSSSLPREVKQRLLKIAGRRITGTGTLIIEARRHRNQERNRQDALRRLITLIKRATFKPKIRLKTRPTKLSKEKRLKAKHQQGEKKRRRQHIRTYD